MNRSRRSAQIFGIEQLERAGGGVAGVLERLLALSPPQFVQPGELGVGHVDLAADLEQGRGGAMKRQGDVPDSAQVGRDVVTPLAVAAGRSQHEPALLVTQRDGHAVHLELDHVGHRLARVQASTDPGIPFPQLFVVVRVVDREHRHGMRHARELGQRRPPTRCDGLSGLISSGCSASSSISRAIKRSYSRSLISGAASR